VAERILLGPATRRDAVSRAAHVLRAGGVALLPAEGLYGYHALASSVEGAARLASIKPREAGKGWIGLVARSADAYRWIAALPAPGAVLIHAHWPGALTLVVEAGPAVPESLRGPEGTIALRCPGSDFLRDVILGAGGLLLSTSANAPGAPPPSSAPAADEVPDGISCVVDAGTLSGEPSTVVRVQGERVTVLRSGAVRLREGPLDALPREP
jgi:tRNA threonylcarbamoyl adenosine modification protein (Sua5/YciO/YrdC/YwlC family)